MLTTVVDLTQFEPINELNKEEMIQWLQGNVETLSDPNYQGFRSRSVNRIFETDQDDITVMRDLCGRFLVTLMNFNILQK